jgi:hypothetical protein
LNPDALVTLPGFFVAAPGTGTPAKYTGLNALHLDLSVNHSPTVVVTFSDATAVGLSPAAVVAAINAAFAAVGLTSARAELVGKTSFRVRTVGVGDFQQIAVLATSSNAVLSAFGLGPQSFVGLTSYAAHKVSVPPTSFPDPRLNMAQLSILNDSTRAFLAIGNGALQEATRTRSFLRRGATDLQAVLTGSVDLTTLDYTPVTGDFDGNTITFTVSGVACLVTFVAPADAGAVVTQINAAIVAAAGSATAVASLTPTTNHLVLTTAATGSTATLVCTSGSLAAATIGLTSGTSVAGSSQVQIIDDGNGDALSPLVDLTGVNVTASAAAASVIGTATIASVRASLVNKVFSLSDGRQTQQVVFPASLPADSDVVAAINAVMGAAAGGGLVAALGGAGSAYLHLSSIAIGDEGQVRIEGNNIALSGDAAVLLGFTTAGAAYPVVTRGTPFPAAPGDELYVDGQLLGNIIQVAPGGATAVVKIDKQVQIDPDFGQSFYIVATKLTGAATATRPSADLQVGLDGTVLIKHELLRDTQGIPMLTRAGVYIAYTAVREDVSPLASNPGLLRFNSTTDVTALLAPVSPNNPLALGLYFALLNAPGSQVTGVGVDAVSSDSPFGTVEAFTRAAEFLESFEVYGIATLTHDLTVAQVYATHASVMSAPENKGERICVYNLSMPTAKLDKLVASGQGNSIGAGGITFDTGVASLSALLLNAGLDPTSTLPVTDGLFLDIASNSLRYSITSISGSQITIKYSGFGPGENDDGFYATSKLNDPPLPSQLINETFAIKIRGASLTRTDGTPDKTGISETIQGQSQAFMNRRFWNIVPDKCAATLNGLEQVIDGFYMAAAVVGMIAQNKPQQSFTNFPMTGFSRVIGSNEYFTERQLNVIAAGGNYIIVQDSQGAPLTSRMALTTDMTSIETRTDSITKVVDFTAKFLRRGLRNFIGRFNITQGFLDSLGHVISGLLGFLQETGVLIGSHLNNIVQDANAPDTVLIDVTLDVPYPCNYIRLTLVI